MADNRTDLTKAAGITADVVMELGAHFSAQEMRKVQTGLTTAARELRALTHHGSLLGRLGDKLSHEQRELLSNAAALLDSVKYNVEHAKERKARDEKAEAKKRQQWEREAEQLVKTHFSLPTDTVAEQLRILELHLVAQAVLGQTFYLKNHLQLRKAMQEEPPRWANHTAAKWRQSGVSSLMADVQSAFRNYLSWELSVTPAKRLQELQSNLEARRTEVLAKPQSVETLRIWTDALKGAAFITTLMPSGGPSR